MIETIISKQVYLFGLIGALVLGGILRKEGYFARFYHWVNTKFNSEKAILAIMSAVGGVLPVEGRCSVSAPFLDSIAKQDHEGRPKMGLVDYVSTHHYYLWSPIEPSVLIFMSVLGITWATFLQATLLPLLVYVMFMFGLLVFYVKDKDIAFDVPVPVESKNKLGVLVAISLIGGFIAILVGIPFYYVFPVLAIAYTFMSRTTWREVLSFINWKLIFGVGVIIALSVVMKSFYGEFSETIKDSAYTLPVLLTVGTGFAFVMGSSSKYAGIGALMVSQTSLTYLPLVVAFEFIGYLLSPVHKCMLISKLYFSTKIKHMYAALLVLVVGIATSSVGAYLLFYK